MSICAYVKCQKVVNEKKPHFEVVGLGVMHLVCHKIYLTETSCAHAKCNRSVDVTGRNAVAHSGKIYHVDCFGEIFPKKQEVQPQLILNLEEV